MNLFDVAVASKLSGGGGGGGSSDITKATVKLINNSSNYVSDIFGCFAVDGEGGDPDISTSSTGVASGETVNATIMLYKGNADLMLFQEVNVTISGNIDGQMGMYMVTGDCTLTFSDPS